MNIIKRDNQKAIIHLSRIAGSEIFLVRAIVFTQTFDGSYVSHLVGIKRMTENEAFELRSRVDVLAQFNIVLVDTDASAAEIIVRTALLADIKKTTPTETEEKPAVSIPSPYASKISILEAFFASQKTRAPTI